MRIGDGVEDPFAGVDELGRCKVSRAAPQPAGKRAVELAFDRYGTAFEVSWRVKGWAVHRMVENARAWHAVTGREGRPLVLPVDADAAELFVAIGGTIGRYCLTPVDATGRPLVAEEVAFVEVVRPVRPLARFP